MATSTKGKIKKSQVKQTALFNAALAKVIVKHDLTTDEGKEAYQKAHRTLHRRYFNLDKYEFSA